jgi:glycogen debranching enzyme
MKKFLLPLPAWGLPSPSANFSSATLRLKRPAVPDQPIPDLKTNFYLFLMALLILGQNCQTPETASVGLADRVTFAGLPGRTEYLNSPYVTAGDRVYMVGHQDGSFPPLGWHVPGEMGGIWDHPIKLMDGFTNSVSVGDQGSCLEADTFINYPFANQHIYSPMYDGHLLMERFQFAPDGKEAVHLEYTFRNNHPSEDISLEFCWTGYSDLRPVWLGERSGMEDGTDVSTWLEELNAWSVKDSLNDWYVVFGSDLKPESHSTANGSCSSESPGKGTQANLYYDLLIPAGGTVRLAITIAGSYHSLDQARQTFREVSGNAAELLLQKQDRYRTLAGHSKLTVPDQDIQKAFEWVKYNTDWLIREVPEIGRGLGAGIPDYPWWFGVDSEYTLQGALAVGRYDLVYATIELLHKLSEQTNGNGRIIHEASTNGVVFNPGNINETPQFASLIWKVYEWTGDRAFLEKYYPTVKQGLDWLPAANDADGNLLPDGFGMMEIHGLNSEMIDVAAYTQRAFSDAAKMARIMEENDLAEAYAQKAEKLRDIINTDFWVPEYQSYADFIGTARQALHLIDDAIVRADTLNKPWAVEELEAAKARVSAYPAERKQGFVLHHNWVVNTPMEMGIADTAKALAALETGSRFVNPFGVFVTGIDRDDTAGKDEGSFAAGKKVFNYTGAVMTLPTGVQAVAENNYGRPDRALDYLRRMTRTFGYALPGSIYEVSPDFGMMTQAWNLYSYAVPIVTQFFGIRPRAYEQTVRIQPQMPEEWPSAGLEQLIIGDNEISVSYEQMEDGLYLRIQQTQPDWLVEVAFPAGKFKTWLLGDLTVRPETIGSYDVLSGRGTENILLKLQP